METRFCTSTWAMFTSAPQRKGHVQGVRAVVVAVGRHVQHPLDADDLLLDRRGHRVGHHLGVGSGVIGSYADVRRRDLRILGDRQEGRGDGPEQDDDDGDHPGQHGAVDEESRQHDSLLFRGRQSEMVVRNQGAAFAVRTAPF